MPRTITIAGASLELVERGAGRPLLFLHAGEGLMPERPWLDLLAQRYRVIAPSHPGWGNSPLIDGAGSVDDLAYLYLDLAAELGLQDAVLVGACFGGWVAAEIMVRSTARFSRLVLVDPLGVKFGGREDRDITDMHALQRDEYLRLAWADPAKGDTDFTALPESELAAIVRGREAFALYGWKPYMHNPRLTALAASDRSADLAVMGRQRPDRDPFLWRVLGSRDPGRPARTDPRCRPLPALGATGSICPAPGGVRRRGADSGGRRRAGVIVRRRRPTDHRWQCGATVSYRSWCRTQSVRLPLIVSLRPFGCDVEKGIAAEEQLAAAGIG